MTLIEALDILARVHTKEDELAGFIVRAGVPSYDIMSAGVTWTAYVDAWGKLRAELNMPYEPKDDAPLGAQLEQTK